MLILLVSNLVFASSEMIPPYYRSTSAGNYYQVMFDGEGEASVLAKFVQMNVENKSLDKIVFEIPGENVKIKYVLQEVQWNNFVPLSYETEQLSKSVKYTARLSQNISTGDTGSILVFYKVMGYADRTVNWGFDFETAKFPSDAEYTRVAISVDSDLYLRGGGTKVDYRNNFVGFESAVKSSAMGEAISGQYADQLRDYSQNVMYASGYVKEKRNLDPWESFHVSGVYVESGLWFLTYWKDAVIAVLALIILKIVLVGRIKSLFKFGEEGFDKEKSGEGRFARIAAVGFVSAASVLIVWWLVFSFLESFMSSYYGPFGVLLALLGGVLVILTLVAPAVYMGSRFGVTDGVLTLAATILWVFLILFVAMLLLGSRYQPIAYITEAFSRTTTEQIIAE